MVEITKKEAEALRKIKPNIEITKTMRQHSSRGKRYCPPYADVIEWLKKTRGVSEID